jgi:hypothetical protein
VSRYYEPRRHAFEIHRAARPIDHYARIGGVHANVGPSAVMLRDHRVNVRPTTLGIRATGRWSSDESRAAVQRAEQRRPIFEQTNRRRIENNTQVYRAQTRIERGPRPEIRQRPQIQQPRPQIQQPRPQIQQPRPQIQQPRPQIQQPRPQMRPHVQQQPPAQRQPQVQPPRQQPQPERRPRR